MPKLPGEPSPLDAPLVFDFAPRKVSYAGDHRDTWFVSDVHGGVIALAPRGEIVGRFALPFIDRVIEASGTLISTCERRSGPR
jgi:hypothetical protein